MLLCLLSADQNNWLEAMRSVVFEETTQNIVTLCIPSVTLSKPLFTIFPIQNLHVVHSCKQKDVTLLQCLSGLL